MRNCDRNKNIGQYGRMRSTIGCRISQREDLIITGKDDCSTNVLHISLQKLLFAVRHRIKTEFVLPGRKYDAVFYSNTDNKRRRTIATHHKILESRLTDDDLRLLLENYSVSQLKYALERKDKEILVEKHIIDENYVVIKTNESMSENIKK